MNVVVGLTKLNDRTGSEVYCVELVRALRRAGHHVEVFALYGSSEMEQELASVGASLCVFPKALSLSPDGVVCMQPLATALLLSRVAKDVPALSIVHGATASEAPASATRIDRWIAVSPYVAQHLEAEGLESDDIEVVPNGIDLEQLSAPELDAPTDRVRVLWASTYIPVRRRALQSLAAAVIERTDAELTVVADRLPANLLPDDDRIRVVAKGREIVELIREHHVVAGLGPGRILLEALAMNRAALCLNEAGAAVYLDADNLARVEFYREAWGGPVAPLLDPQTAFANANRRGLAADNYDAAPNMARVIDTVETLTRRSSAPLRYRLVTLRRVPALAFNLALVPWLKLRLRPARTGSEPASATGA